MLLLNLGAAGRAFHAVVTIQLYTNAGSVSRALGHAAYRQVPYAMARALNDLAADVRDAERLSLGRSLTVRSRRVPQAIRIVFADKRQRPIQSQVGILSQDDAFLALHATGGDKRPGPGRRFIAIPTKLVKRGSSGKVRAGQKPGALLSPEGKAKGYFVEDGKSKTIEERLSKKRQRTRLGRLGGTATWYLLRAKARIKPVWPFARTAKLTVQLRYDQHFQRRLFIAANEARSQVRMPRQLQGPVPFIGPRLPS